MSFPHRWRAPVTGAVTGLVLAVAVVGPSALASGGSAGPATATTGCDDHAASAGVKSPAAPAESDGPFLAAVRQMVQAGTINDPQARILDADIRIGRIDPDQLVADGKMSSAQAHALMDRLGAIKRSMAPAAQQCQIAKPADRNGSRG